MNLLRNFKILLLFNVVSGIGHAMEPEAQITPEEQYRKRGEQLLAASRSDKNIATINGLIALGADLNITSENNETPLIRAAKNGAYAIAKTLIESGANIDKSDKTKKTPLIWAAGKGHSQIVQALLEVHAEINRIDQFNNTALFLAVINNHEEIAKILLDAGANPDIQGAISPEGGMVPLVTAIIKNNIELVGQLVKAGADIYAKGKDGKTAFNAAAGKPQILEILRSSPKITDIPLQVRQQKGQELFKVIESNREKENIEEVNRLISEGANVNIKVDNVTPLFRAAGYGHLDTVKALIAAGAEVNTKIDYGHTPLITAATQGRNEVVKELIEAQAHLNATDQYNNTALFRAITSKHNDIAKILVEAGANVDVPGDWRAGGGRPPLFEAVSNRDVELVQMLVDAGADVNAYGPQRKSIFDIVLPGGRGEIKDLEILEILRNPPIKHTVVPTPEVRQIKGRELSEVIRWQQKDARLPEVQKLIAEGADLNAIGYYNRSVLNDAIGSGQNETAKLLIDAGADPNFRVRTNDTPLLLAVRTRNLEILKYLLDAGASPDDFNYQTGETPLMLAVSRGDNEMVNTLLEKKASLNIVDRYQTTALLHAIIHQHLDTAKILIEAGADVNIPGDWREGGPKLPLFLAIDHNNFELAKSLLDAGADPNAKGPWGKSIMALAEERKNPQILEILKKPIREEVIPQQIEEACTVLATPQDDIIQYIMQDIDKIPSGGYIGLESPSLSNSKLIPKLKEAAQRGVTVHVYVDPLDKNHNKYSYLYDDHLRASGVQIFEVPDLHAKRIIIAENKPIDFEIFGDVVLYIGSMNLTDNAPDNIEIMAKCTNKEHFLQNYRDQMLLSTKQYRQQPPPAEMPARRTLNSITREANAQKLNLIKELPQCKNPDDSIYIASMTFDDKEFLDELIKAQKEFTKPIKVILDRESWKQSRIRYYYLKPLVRAGADIYIYNRDGTKKTPREFEKLFHIKAILSVCNQQCTAVISTGNLTEQNKKTINHDLWEPCSQNFSNKLKSILDNVIKESDRLDLSSFD